MGGKWQRNQYVIFFSTMMFTIKIINQGISKRISKFDLLKHSYTNCVLDKIIKKEFRRIGIRWYDVIFINL